MGRKAHMTKSTQTKAIQLSSILEIKPKLNI